MLNSGTSKADRTGDRYPQRLRASAALRPGGRVSLITTKKVHLKSIIYELLWFLRGGSNIGWLNEHGVTIWDEWADPFGELGPISRRAVAGSRRRRGTSTRSPRPRSAQERPGFAAQHRVGLECGEIPQMALPPCHAFFSSMSPTENCRASCISAAPTCSSACRSTSRRTHCSPT